MSTLPSGVASRLIDVGGIRTHYLEAGDGKPLILLHDGGFGGSARLTWFRNIQVLAQSYRVIAPDWLGFGGTDKIYDFCGNRSRRLNHMTRFIDLLCIDDAAFMGCSMGATLLLQVAATGEQPWPIAALISVSGGGFVPLNEARKKALSFDCTLESMRDVVSTYVHRQHWLEVPEMVAERFQQAIAPGAWEAVAAARFKSPIAAPLGDFGNEDDTPYSRIDIPVLLAAGRHDALREPDYVRPLQEAIPGAECAIFEESGHMPNIEEADLFNSLALDFLRRHYTSDRG